MKFTILGEPVPKGRPRLAVINGHPLAYTPKETREAEKNLRAQIVQQLPKGKVPLCSALQVEIWFYRSKPKSKSKKDVYPKQKPDVDNLIKTVMDAMNEVVFVDDAQIVSLSAHKRYDDRPRIEITIEEMVRYDTVGQGGVR